MDKKKSGRDAKKPRFPPAFLIRPFGPPSPRGKAFRSEITHSAFGIWHSAFIKLLDKLEFEDRRERIHPIRTKTGPSRPNFVSERRGRRSLPYAITPPSESEVPMSLPERKLHRLKDWDYSQPGYYFITICTQNRRCLLSTIVGRGLAPAEILFLAQHFKRSTT